jgi:hypothetical protein
MVRIYIGLETRSLHITLVNDTRPHQKGTAKSPEHPTISANSTCLLK